MHSEFSFVNLLLHKRKRKAPQNHNKYLMIKINNKKKAKGYDIYMLKQ